MFARSVVTKLLRIVPSISSSPLNGFQFPLKKFLHADAFAYHSVAVKDIINAKFPSTYTVHSDLDLYSSYTYGQKRAFSSAKSSWFRKRRKNISYDIVEPADVSKEPRVIGDHIMKPDYATTGVTNENRTEIEVKNANQIQCMRESCAVCRAILDEVSKHVQVGRTTDELDYIVHCLCNSYGAYPSPLNYRGFPKSVCTSVNNIACHGIPDSRPLKDGDIISIDVSVYYNGYHGDCAATYGVGNVDFKGEFLMSIALKCLEDTVGICQPGQPFCLIGKTISDIASKHGFSVVPAFCGHGIGTYFHGPPNILHCENDDQKLMQEGMTFTIEPVICEGEPDIVILEDGWTAATEDNSRCAQFEHTVLITKDGAEILTKPSAFTAGIVQQ